MELGELKPFLTRLAMPPLSLLLLALIGLFGLVGIAKRKRGSMALATLSLVLLWLLSCHGMAVLLARTVLPQFVPASAAQLKTAKVQAIVVLGGGLLPLAPEYGQPQPSPHTASRLRYGVFLSRQSGLPLAFTGGVGWGGGSDAASMTSEASVVAQVARAEYGVELRWQEDQSRDTSENALYMSRLLRQDKVQRIALVTDATHMPRALQAFKLTGLDVIPAPTGYVLAEQSDLLEWLPSANGLLESQLVLREWLAWAVARGRQAGTSRKA